ncbi:MAG TPA: hypothetical protein VD731_03205 [Nitrosopumilaceae archaeon]|nr:hypothetical protein [Nitrosopumilaceae archaeon]
MSEAEREYIKTVDEAILKASGKTLKKFQDLDIETQLHSNTFYDAYALHSEHKKENVPSPQQHFRKNK